MNPIILKSHNKFERAVSDGATMELGVEFWVEVLEDIYRRRDGGVRARMAQMRQARIKQASDRMPQRVTETMGEARYKVDPEAYHAWAWRFRDANDRPDYSCWDDEQFVHEWLRDNEESRVRIEKRGNHVGWRASLDGKVKLAARGHGRRKIKLEGEA